MRVVFNCAAQFSGKSLNDHLYTEKAFDKVDHAIVLAKLKQLGVSGSIHRWIESFLTERYQSVIVNGVKSKAQKVISGVPQGSVLGPLIFLILIGDIDEKIMHCILKSFADDTRATKSIKNTKDVEILQKELEKVYDWTEENNMKLNDMRPSGTRACSAASCRESSAARNSRPSPCWRSSKSFHARTAPPAGASA